ncbi:MAG: hypothetical protein KGY67_00410 [Candidatus Thermoplasmatota archaeon]|nr:hypothetical protein [Candidatus Thermoplasmatota archaeon]
MAKHVKKTIIALLLMDSIIILIYLLLLYVIPVMYELPRNNITSFITFFIILFLINSIAVTTIVYMEEK